jgi:hypothetical protein
VAADLKDAKEEEEEALLDAGTFGILSSWSCLQREGEGWGGGGANV